MTLKSILPLAALALPLAVPAQNNPKVEEAPVNVSFDFEPNPANPWRELGVFDTWEESPFRTGKLKGNVAVVDNPTLDELNPLTGLPVNPSKCVLGLQRSRFGSNTFGARIVLQQPVALTPKPLYIHAWVRSPKAGRVLIAGLGKRKERTKQVDDVVQVAEITTSPLEVNQWREIVVPAAANKGVELHSLVIVPDCESPHDLKEDFVAYIDNVSINTVSAPTLIRGYYPINFDKAQPHARKDRYIEAVQFTIDKQKFNYVLPQPRMLYNEAGVSHRIFAKAGDVVTPKVQYKGSWMHTFFYVDFDQDGQFKPEEVVSYSYKDGKNSAGKTFANGGMSFQSPEFTLPQNMKPGVYRMRLKVDYDDLDPMGHKTLPENGGGFVDFLLNIHDGAAIVNDHNLNGAVKTLDGKELTSLQVPYGQDFTIKMHPADGFEHNGFVLKHGVNLNGEATVKDNVQWETITIPRSIFNADGTYTIPGKWMDGNVLIEGRFVQEGRYKPEPVPAWFSRFNVTSIDGKYFAPNTQWYSLQLGEQGYVIYGTSESHIALEATAVDAKNQQHLWCFVGNNEAGFQLYNRYFGTGYVLAAPTTMSGVTGGSSFVRLVPANQVPRGYTAVWRFMDSKDLKAEGADVVYMYEDKFPANRANNRDNRLAFWTGGADKGSTFVIRPVEMTEPAVTSIALPNSATSSNEVFDLSGRRAESTSQGVLVMNGKKVVK